MKKNLRFYAIIFAVAVVAEFATCSLAGVGCFRPFLSGFGLSSLARLVVFFALTLYFLNRFKEVLKPSCVVGTMLIGATILELIIHLFDFMNSLISLPEMLINIVAILTAWFCAGSAAKPTKTVVCLVVLAAVVYFAFWGYKVWGRFAFAL
ncbi:MAG: hypothetical protein IJN01_06310 [Rikenellaceae bacterium]|nr:hypothetical protein [Rikenellaceae bacterium]